MAPDVIKPFKLAVNASDIRVDGNAKMMTEGLIIQCVISQKKFNNGQKRYCTTEQELLALILALQYFDIYVATAGGPIAVFMDQNPITFLHKLKNMNKRLICSGEASFYSSTA